MNSMKLSGIVVAFFAVMLVATACGGSSHPATSTAPSARSSATAATTTDTPSPSPTATTAPSPVVPGARAVSAVDDTEFPPDTNMLIVDGSWGKDGGPFDLRRVYRIGQSQVYQAKLYEPPAGYMLTSVFAPPDAHVIYVSICKGEDCGYLGQVTDVTTTFLRSDDGGVTWQELGQRPAQWYVRGLYEGHCVAISWDMKQVEYIDVDANTLLDVPPVMRDLTMVSAGDTIGWWRPNNISIGGMSGSSLLKPAGIDATALRGVELLLGEHGTPGVMTASIANTGSSTPAQKPNNFLFVYPRDVDGEPQAFTFPDGGTPQLGAWLDAGHVLVTQGYDRKTCHSGISVGSAPAILDISTATLAFIGNPFLADPCSGNAQRVIAAQTGPLAMIAAGGDCLNLRTDASQSAPAARCLTTGVIVSVTGPAVTGDGLEWLPVKAPDGTAGFVAKQFVSTTP